MSTTSRLSTARPTAQERDRPGSRTPAPTHYSVVRPAHLPARGGGGTRRAGVRLGGAGRVSALGSGRRAYGRAVCGCRLVLAAQPQPSRGGRGHLPAAARRDQTWSRGGRDDRLIQGFPCCRSGEGALRQGQRPGECAGRSNDGRGSSSIQSSGPLRWFYQ